MCIWGFPFFVSWGIGGKYYLQKGHNEHCEKNVDFEIPSFVELIFWGQFLSFTSFGVLCSWQAICATPVSEQKRRLKWIQYSFAYSVLSITAKTLLEIGFLGYVSMYKPWQQVADVVVQAGACPALPAVQVI